MRLKDRLDGLTCVVHRDVPATGVISYGQTHEPHCEACCKQWEGVLWSERFAHRAYTLGISDLRVWQANMASAA